MDTTIADRALSEAQTEMLCCVLMAKLGDITARRELVARVRACVRASRDVEKQRAFERGLEAFGNMLWTPTAYTTPTRRYGQPGEWTGD